VSSDKRRGDRNQCGLCCGEKVGAIMAKFLIGYCRVSIADNRTAPIPAKVAEPLPDDLLGRSKRPSTVPSAVLRGATEAEVIP